MLRAPQPVLVLVTEDVRVQIVPTDPFVIIIDQFFIFFTMKSMKGVVCVNNVLEKAYQTPAHDITVKQIRQQWQSTSEPNEARELFYHILKQGVRTFQLM